MDSLIATSFPLRQFITTSLRRCFCFAFIALLCLSITARAQVADNAGTGQKDDAAGDRRDTQAEPQQDGAAQGEQAEDEKTDEEQTTTEQTTTEQPEATFDADALSGEVKTLVESGAYDDAIQKASPALEKDDESDVRLLYWRGFAAWRIGYFGMAEHDLALASTSKKGKVPGPATEYLLRVRALKAMAPENIYEVKAGDATIFRVYYDDRDAWTSAIIKLLPRAYAISHDMVGRDMVETPVFIFSDYERFSRFYQVRGGGPPGSWIWAAGGIGGFYFCRNTPKAAPEAYEISSDYFQSTVIHEFNHCLVNRVAGDGRLPNWLKEGMAEVAETRFAATRGANLTKRMAQIMQWNTVLPPKELSDTKSFTQNTEEGLARRDNGQPAPDPYAQSYFMAGYFLTLLPQQGLPNFLDDVREQRDYEKVFEKHTGLTMEAFFQEWAKWMQKQ